MRYAVAVVSLLKQKLYETVKRPGALVLRLVRSFTAVVHSKNRGKHDAPFSRVSEQILSIAGTRT